jgi:hypothetical protein
MGKIFTKEKSFISLPGEDYRALTAAKKKYLGDFDEAAAISITKVGSHL